MLLMDCTEKSSTDTAFAHAECVGTDSELAGKAAGCAGCPNQEACATAPKGPDPGALLAPLRMECGAYM